MNISSLCTFVTLIGCGISLGATTTITDFTDLYNGTSVDGIALTDTNAHLTSTGGIGLSQGSLAFNMASAANRPSLASGSAFSVALTFDLNSLSGTQSTLFSQTTSGKTGAFNGLFGAEYRDGGVYFGYWGTGQTNTSFGNASPHISLNADATGTLSIVWSKNSANIVSLSVYNDGILCGTLTSNSALSFSGANMNILSVGGKGVTDAGNISNSFTSSSDLSLLGMQIMTGSTMNDEAFQDYFNQLNIPEPATASLSLLGLGFLFIRRRHS